ncbi:MAG: radical SAM protein, partial [Xanthobacteraceae bacterium]
MRASQSLRRPAELIEAGLAPAERRAALAAVAERYAVAITPAVAELIDTADPDDPIARQFIPDPAELMVRPEELADPIGDDVHSPVEGVVHRYPDRVLLKLVHVCPVYCRFCFRREMVGPRGRGTLSPRKLEAALDYIRAQDRIWEVILTGGDPLVLAARRVRAVMRELAAIDHVKIIRVHTRVPVVAPALITPELARALR